MVTVGVKAIFGNFSMLIEACVCVGGGGVQTSAYLHNKDFKSVFRL